MYPKLFTDSYISNFIGQSRCRRILEIGDILMPSRVITPQSDVSQVERLTIENNRLIQ